MSEKQAVKKDKTSFLKSLITDLFIAAAIFCIITTFIKPTVVNGDSMDSTLKDGDYLITMKQAYKATEPEYGDIVVFDSPTEDALYIKRIIATEGQNVEVSGGHVYVDGELINEDYIHGQDTEGDLALKVPEGEVFVMGDNREVSFDSREFGCIDVDSLEGKATIRLFPHTKLLNDK